MTEYFDTPDKLYLVLDYVEGGELFDRIVDEVGPSHTPTAFHLRLLFQMEQGYFGGRSRCTWT